MFSSRRSSFVVPGIGTIHGRWASNQASAICASEDLAEIDRVASEIRDGGSSIPRLPRADDRSLRRRAALELRPGGGVSSSSRMTTLSNLVG
jgi:hypothetical protein